MEHIKDKMAEFEVGILKWARSPACSTCICNLLLHCPALLLCMHLSAQISPTLPQLHVRQILTVDAKAMCVGGLGAAASGQCCALTLTIASV